MTGFRQTIRQTGTDKRLKRYEGFDGDQPPGRRVIYVHATSPRSAQRLLDDVEGGAWKVLSQQRTPTGPGWGAAYGSRH